MKLEDDGNHLTVRASSQVQSITYQHIAGKALSKHHYDSGYFSSTSDAVFYSPFFAWQRFTPDWFVWTECFRLYIMQYACGQ